MRSEHDEPRDSGELAGLGKSMEEWVSCFLRLERLNLAAAAEEKTSGRECAALVSELGHRVQTPD